MAIDKNKIAAICKKEAVLLICALAAAVSMLFVAPDAKYASYIDVRVLALLFCLMAAVGSAKELGVFRVLCKLLLARAGNARAAALVLVLLSFFCSMLITNDVALITFVPLAVAVLGAAAPREMIATVVMQTIAANLGSSLTPVGNPQNLYLSAFYNMGIGEFFRLTVPIVAAGLVLTAICTFMLVKPTPCAPTTDDGEKLDIPRLLVSTALFALSVASVLRFVDYKIVLLVVCAVLIPVNRCAFKHVDISLLLTFVFLFVFAGNMARIEGIRSLLAGLMEDNALLASVGASQAISNVPAALMLSGFTENGAALVLGTNIGGLGTPIASMASLISLRVYSNTENADTKKYLLVFLLFNFAFLALLLIGENLL